MSNEILGIVALLVLFAVIFVGFPIAFTLGAVSLATGFIALGPVVFDLAVLQTFSVMRDIVLASIPFFLFMGFLPEQSGLVERLFHGIQQLLAGVRGSLYLAVLITATIFAAATGIVGSAVTLLGVMAGQPMIKSGYDTKLSAGAIAAGGTLGILIPPSVMLIVMGPVVGVPATDLFAAAVIPGLLLSAIFTIWCLVRCWINPSPVPAGCCSPCWAGTWTGSRRRREQASRTACRITSAAPCPRETVRSSAAPRSWACRFARCRRT